MEATPNRTGIKGFAILCVTIPPRGPNNLKKRVVYF